MPYNQILHLKNEFQVSNQFTITIQYFGLHVFDVVSSRGALNARFSPTIYFDFCMGKWLCFFLPPHAIFYIAYVLYL